MKVLKRVQPLSDYHVGMDWWPIKMAIHEMTSKQKGKIDPKINRYIEN